MRFYWLFLGTLSVWRLTHLLAAEDGPWNLITKLRTLARTGLWKSLLDCFYCLSLWVSFPFAWLIAEDGIKEIILLWLGFSAGAIALERLTTLSQPPPAHYFEDNEQEEFLPNTGQNEDQKVSTSTVDNATANSASEQAVSPAPDYDAPIVIVQSENGRFRLH